MSGIDGGRRSRRVGAGGQPMRRTLALVAAATSSMIALAFVIPLALAVRQVAHDRALHDAERQATALAPVLEIAEKPADVVRAMDSLPAGRQKLLAVHLSDGTVLGPARGREEDLRLAEAQSRTFAVPTPDGYLLLEPVMLSRGRTAVIEVGVPGSDVTRGVAVAWAVMGLIALALVAASVVVADRLAARMVRASAGLAGAARRLGGGDLDVRVTPAGPTELAAAGVAFNAMADRVVELLAAERELVADLSHRLRTPLTALRLDAEAVGSSPAAQRVRHAAGQLEREIDGIIRAARSPLGAGLGGSCDAAEVLRVRMRFWSALAADQRRPCEVIGTDRPVPVPLPRADMIAVVDALVGNVFRYTPVGCRFSVALRLVDGSTCLIVEDAGPGIVDAAAAMRRGASGGGSTGLGLDIARRAAENSGGAVRISRGTMGGARVWLRFGSVHPSARAATVLPGRRWRRRAGSAELAG
jgi:signal transduction histidine kinase